MYASQMPNAKGRMQQDQSLLLDLIDLVSYLLSFHFISFHYISFDGMLNKFGGFDSLHRCAIRLACTGHGWLGGCVLKICLPSILNTSHCAF